MRESSRWSRAIDGLKTSLLDDPVLLVIRAAGLAAAAWLLHGGMEVLAAGRFSGIDFSTELPILYLGNEATSAGLGVACYGLACLCCWSRSIEGFLLWLTGWLIAGHLLFTLAREIAALVA